MRSFASLFLLLSTLCALATPEATALTVSADGRQMMSDDGHPIFLNGASPWNILARLDRTETLQYLDSRRAMGFNALLLRMVVTDGYHTGSFDNAYGDPPFVVDNDFSQPNEAYFQHVDWFMEQANQRGFYLLIAPAYIGYRCGSEGFCQAMIQNGVDTMRDYGRWVGSRYGSWDNVIWVDGGDELASSFDAMDVVEAVVEGIRETSPNQLHTAHSGRYLSAADGYDRPWLDLNNTYSDCEQTPSNLRLDWFRTPTRPSFYIEGYYEGEHGASDVCLRSQAYWSLLGGALGHFLGNRPMWDFWDGWQQALNSSGSQSMRYLGEFVHSRDWNRLEPDWDHEVLIGGYGTPGAGYAAAARTTTGHTVIVYTPDQRELSVDMTRLSGSKATAWWFNPGNGTTVFIATIPTTGVHEFYPPFSGDWVLVLDDESIGLPAPGQEVGAETRSTGAFKSRSIRRY